MSSVAVKNQRYFQEAVIDGKERPQMLYASMQKKKTNGLIFPERRLKIGKIKHRPQKMVEGPFHSGRGLFQL
jgi:hypothetical protein